MSTHDPILSRRWVPSLCLAVALLLAACGGDDDDVPAEAAEATPAGESVVAEEPTAVPEEGSDGADTTEVSDLSVDDWAAELVAIHLDARQQIQAAFVANTIDLSPDVAPDVFVEVTISLC